MFDADKKMTLEGTIKRIPVDEPHSWILMNVPNAAGAQEQWAIELGAPGGLARQGWVPKTLTPGMKVTACDPSAQGRHAWRPVHGSHASDGTTRATRTGQRTPTRARISRLSGWAVIPVRGRAQWTDVVAAGTLNAGRAIGRFK